MEVRRMNFWQRSRSISAEMPASISAALPASTKVSSVASGFAGRRAFARHRRPVFVPRCERRGIAARRDFGLPARQMIGRGQIDVEDRAAAGRIVETDLPMHAHDDLPHDAQPETGAGFFVPHRGIGLRELFENPRLEFRWDAGTVIAHRYANMIAMLLDRNDDFFPRW